MPDHAAPTRPDPTLAGPQVTTQAATLAATLVKTQAGPPDAEPAAQQALRRALIAQALRAAPAEGSHATAVPALQVIRADRTGQRLPAVYEPGLVLVLQGRKQATLGQQLLRYDPLHCLLASVTMLPLAQITEATPDQPYLCLRLRLAPQELAALLLESGPALAAAAPPAAVLATGLAPGLQLAPVDGALLDAMARLMALLDTPQHLPVLAPLALREIFYRVLTGPLGPQLRALVVADSRAERIARAIALLRQRFAEPVRVDELAAAAAMSASSLHQHFKQVTALSPLQYQKQLRLHQARQLMLGQGLDAASAAHQVGYESASQFSREYRRLFGAPPGAEADRLRGAVVSTVAG